VFSSERVFEDGIQLPKLERSLVILVAHANGEAGMAGRDLICDNSRSLHSRHA
jgi:hypothetical protein